MIFVILASKGEGYKLATIDGPMVQFGTHKMVVKGNCAMNMLMMYLIYGVCLNVHICANL